MSKFRDGWHFLSEHDPLAGRKLARLYLHYHIESDVPEIST